MALTSQMARRMGFSVVGLPHYTIWHLYEPSVDDLKHMEELAHEQEQREKEEKEEARQNERVNSLFQDPKSQWEVDGAVIHDAVMKEQKQDPKNVEAQKGSGEGPAASPVKESSGAERQ